MLICRNVLLYFNAETQNKVLNRLHFATNDAGFLFLGRAEMLLTYTKLFTPIDFSARIFSHAPKINLRNRPLVMTQDGNEETVNHLIGQVRLREIAYETGPFAQLLLDSNDTVVMINEHARSLFRLDAKDIGQPFQDLQKG